MQAEAHSPNINDTEELKREEVTTLEILSLLKDPNVSVIDVRSMDAYNGWRELNERRGGHIPGAKSFPRTWFNNHQWVNIAKHKGILPANTVIIYGYRADHIRSAVEEFRKAGYYKVRGYFHFLDEWVNGDFPVDRLKRFEKLVSPEWLKELIDTGNAPEYNNSKFVICHVHYRQTEDYDLGHIPGAVDLDTNTLEDEVSWNVRPAEELEVALLKLGVTSDTTVILYGRFSSPNPEEPFPGSSAGQLAAMRSALIMMYAGVKDVRVLNGGIHSWIARGYDLSFKKEQPEAAASFGLKIPAHPEFIVDLDEAKEILRSEDANLVCVRSWDEFTGKVSGYNYISKRGRIPGAVFANCGSSAYHMENYRNWDHTTREYQEIKKNWLDSGITKSKFNAFYCGTGWRASEAFFNAWLMGWDRIAVFDGGWLEWSNSGLPYETGTP